MVIFIVFYSFPASHKRFSKKMGIFVFMILYNYPHPGGPGNVVYVYEVCGFRFAHGMRDQPHEVHRVDTFCILVPL